MRVRYSVSLSCKIFPPCKIGRSAFSHSSSWKCYPCRPNETHLVHNTWSKASRSTIGLLLRHSDILTAYQTAWNFPCHLVCHQTGFIRGCAPMNSRIEPAIMQNQTPITVENASRSLPSSYCSVMHSKDIEKRWWIFKCLHGSTLSCYILITSGCIHSRTCLCNFCWWSAKIYSSSSQSLSSNESRCSKISGRYGLASSSASPSA